MQIGIIREGKVPPDSRVPLTPAQCVEIQEKYPEVQFTIQPSPNRCYKDAEYEAAGLKMQEDLSECEVLLGVKEVPINQLVSDKTYFFFSHTIKEQPYNRILLQTILQKNIRLLDYEVLTNEHGQRVIAFGRFAGIAGAHNGLMTYGKRTGAYKLQQMVKFDDFAAAIDRYQQIDWPAMKVVLTGDGRVANGAAEVLEHAGIKKVNPDDFLNKDFDFAVYTQLSCFDYAKHKHETYEGRMRWEQTKNQGGKRFELQHFFDNPEQYESTFKPYTKVADLMINGIYWDNRAPQFFTAEDMQSEEFAIQVIADVTCDIAPVASIPSTLYASTIADPVFGYDPQKGKDVDPFQEHTVDMMTIDNLPNEMPRDASLSFGEQFMESVLDELLGKKDTGMMERATIAEGGKLGKHFEYLKGYVETRDA